MGIDNVLKQLKNYGGYFDVEKLDQEIASLEALMQEEDFWNDKRKSENVITNCNALKQKKSSIADLKQKIEENMDLCSLLEDDESILYDLAIDLGQIVLELEKLEIKMLLNGPYDAFSAVLEIHAGAGGTDACDWASMLFRMYQKWCHNHDYKLEALDMQSGDGTGYKSISVLVKGVNAYGYLKCEKGIHRLVRISPFDSDSRRHTSFASVIVTPLFDLDKIDIVIKENKVL